MPPLRSESQRDRYKYTCDLSFEQRKESTCREMERIIRQKGRPDVSLRRGHHKFDLILAWLQQDIQLLKRSHKSLLDHDLEKARAAVARHNTRSNRISTTPSSHAGSEGPYDTDSSHSQESPETFTAPALELDHSLPQVKASSSRKRRTGRRTTTLSTQPDPEVDELIPFNMLNTQERHERLHRENKFLTTEAVSKMHDSKECRQFLDREEERLRKQAKQHDVSSLMPVKYNVEHKSTWDWTKAKSDPSNSW